MLVADISRRVRSAAGDLSVLQFTEDTLVDWINDGVRECVIENYLLQARATSDTVANQSEYVLPTDILKLHSVYVDGYKLTVQTLEEWEQTNAVVHDTTPVTSGQQFTCYVFAGVLNLWPTPADEQPIVINYSKLPAPVVYNPGPPSSYDPITLPIPESFHNHIVVYCLAQVAFQDDDYAKYNALMNQFKSSVVDLKSLKDSEDLYSFISVSPRDQGDWY